MYSKKAIYKGEIGLFGSYATNLVKECFKYNCTELWIEKNGRRSLLTSLLGIMSLGVATGDTIEISAEGPEAELAVNELCKYVESL